METLQALLDLFNIDGILARSVRIVVVILIAFVTIFIITRLLKKLEVRLARQGIEDGDFPTESRKRAQTLYRLGKSLVVITVWITAAMMILTELGVDIGPMLAGAGIVGIAVGFGAQSLVKDYFAGFFLVLENQIRVGDAAKINGTLGFVEEISFRTIIIRDRTGEVHIFPHGTVTTLSNLSNEWSAYLFDIGVAYKENTDQVVELIKQVVSEMRHDDKYGKLIIEDVEIYGVNRFADSAVEIQGRIKTRPIRQWEVGREFNRRLKLLFDSTGIEIPFPHRTIYFGEASKPITITHTHSPEHDNVS